jgi:hypothetical protein
MSTIEELMRELPPDLQREVEEFARALRDKRAAGNRPRRKPTLSWAGALRDLDRSITSVDLQHEAAKLREGGR